eukprot:6158614-Alexandrium_andersonii.AAC.1
MQRQIDELRDEARANKKEVDACAASAIKSSAEAIRKLDGRTEAIRQTQSTMARKVAHFGRRAEMALSSALWCADARTTSQNR